MSLEIWSGSILDFEGDCIVNPANGFLMHGAGLAKVIAAAASGKASAGSLVDPHDLAAVRDWFAEQRHHPTIATGNVGVTSAGVLPYKGIIHAVGPVWNGGHFYERQLLRSAYTEACAAAHARGWNSIAFPAISCGLFGFPVDIAARLAMSVLKFWSDEQDMEIVIYPFGHEAAFEDAGKEIDSRDEI